MSTSSSRIRVSATTVDALYCRLRAEIVGTVATLARDNAVEALISACSTGRVCALSIEWLMNQSLPAVIAAVMPLLNGCPDHDAAARWIAKSAAPEIAERAAARKAAMAA